MEFIEFMFQNHPIISGAIIGTITSLITNLIIYLIYKN